MARRQTQDADAWMSADAQVEWLAACRRIVASHRELFAEERGIATRTVYAGIGEGGDRTLAIDRRCEDLVFDRLEELHASGHAFTAISEERGEVTFGEPESGVWVIVDPLDGSLNARRMLPSHSLSIAVASGPTMAQVEFAYVYDFGASEEYTARRGEGAHLNDDPLRAVGPGFGLEVVGIESAKPERTVPVLAALEGKAYRIRAVGSIAITLCYVAGGRFDGMLTGRACRSVDAAAGQLVAREAGAAVAFAGNGLDVSLDLDARYHVAAALDRDLLATVLEAQEHAEPPAKARHVTDRRLVDWGLAQRIAVRLAGDDRGVGPFQQSAVDSACADAVALVGDYTGLQPKQPLPAPELIDRAEWARIGVRSLRELSEELDRGFAAGIRLPGPLGGVARSLAGAAAAAEAGVAVGYGARKVLGQYDLALAGAEREPRLVFVGPNLVAAHSELGEDAGLFLRWIAIHESTHSIQFASVPWLRSHLAGLLDQLIGKATARLDHGSLGAAARGLLRADPRKAIRAVMRGDLPRLLAGPDQALTLDALQATMSVIEGYAEHVMDAAGGRLDRAHARLRARLDARRANRGGLAEVIARLLGMELKLRQYRLGKRFCDEVAAEAGTDGLNEVWRAPEALPTVAELEQPLAWLGRVARPVSA